MEEEQQTVDEQKTSYEAFLNSLEDSEQGKQGNVTEVQEGEKNEEPKPAETPAATDDKNVPPEDENQKRLKALEAQLDSQKAEADKKAKEANSYLEQLKLLQKEKADKENKDLEVDEISEEDLSEFSDEAKAVLQKFSQKNKILASKLKDFASFMEEQKSKAERQAADEQTQREYNEKFNSQTLPEIIKVEPEYMKFMADNGHDYFNWANTLSQGLKNAFTSSLDANDLLEGLRAYKQYKKLPAESAAETEALENNKKIQGLSQTPLANSRTLNPNGKTKTQLAPEEVYNTYIAGLDKAEREGRI